MEIFSFMIIVFCMFVPSPTFSTTAILSVSQFISDGETLVSDGGVFELGFFSPGNSKKRYLGIWYKNIHTQTTVWVANRANPINDSSGILRFSNTGNLELRQNDSVVWYTTNKKQAQNPVAELLHSGNLVIRNEGETNTEAYLWQSFDYPTDTLLPGMKLGRDFQTGVEWKLTAWKSPDDPSPGHLSWALMLHNYPEFYVMNETSKFYRTGPWNGLQFSGASDIETNSLYESRYVSENDPMHRFNKVDKFYSYTVKYSSMVMRVKINETTSSLDTYVLLEDTQSWAVYRTSRTDFCDTYGICGAYGNCRNSECQCLERFTPKSPQQWKASNWTQGCIPPKPFSCKDSYADGFVLYVRLKVPDTTYAWLDENIDLEECRSLCLKNCSCTAYTNSDIREAGSGCVLWFGDLIDIRQFQTGGQDLYIRMPGTVLDLLSQRGHSKSLTIIINTTVSAISAMLLFCIFVTYRVRRNIADKSKAGENIEGQLKDLDLPFFDLLTITTATNNFSLNNKIGQGGFGPVFKGKLADGREIAVKRLSRSSGQGITEFITEVKLIVKLQHRNLVKLLGCCIRGQEKLLVYEYMVNGSLDSILFDKIKGKFLDWPRRFNIIFGIARGLLYLHQDSRLRIIHRDLKASNVLLDENSNPKISDFGMARAFGGDQTEGNTNRVVGTYGYMAPEYAVDGLFSIKSDVFSFGILLLEIICGNKNRALCHGNQTLNLVGYAWTLWKEKNALQLIDSSIKDSCVIPEVLRCIHVSLLCVQQYPEDRPTMSLVIQMLGSEMEPIEPKEPGFFQRRISEEEKLSKNPNQMSSNDELTITSFNGR